MRQERETNFFCLKMGQEKNFQGKSKNSSSKISIV